MNMAYKQKKSKLISLTASASKKAGGKALGLYNLNKIGLNVPKGFVLTLNPNESSLPLIKKAWKALDFDTVAVRSSASDEDGEHASAAGQYESYLNLKSEEEILDAVLKCTDSLNSLRVESYRKVYSNSTVKSDIPVMNVIIQKMSKPKYAGVIFTVNPITGEKDQLMIEAVEGNGELLVDGTKAAIQYLTKRNGKILEIENRDNVKEFSSVFLNQLISEASFASEKIGGPLDLEWSLDTDGTLHWLQSRAVTNINNNNFEFDYNVKSESEIFTRYNIGEMIPGAVTPITLSLFGESMNDAMHYLYKKCGAIHKGNKKERFVVSFSNHLVFNFTSIYSMVGRVFGAKKEALELSILGKTIDDPVPFAPISKLRQMKNASRYFTSMANHKKYLKKLSNLEKTCHFKPNIVDLSDIKSSFLKKTFRNWNKKINTITKAYCYHLVISGNSGFRNSILQEILTRKKSNNIIDQSVISQLLGDIENIESAKAVKDIEGISDSILENKSFKQQILSESDEQSLKRFLNSPTKTGQLFRKFLENHGHRAISEAEFRIKGWDENPLSVVSIIKQNLRVDYKQSKSVKNENIQPIISVDTKGRAVKWALTNCKDAVRERELSKSISIKIQHKFKKQLRYIAKLMVKLNIISDEDQIYFITIDELKEIILDDKKVDLQKIESRRESFKYQQEIGLPDIWRGTPSLLLKKESKISAKGLIQGTPVSAGSVVGKVRIIKNVEDATKLKTGEIMVASLTDIGWSPWYSIASGMITEIGSALSHGSVIAREYGLPLVTNINNATSCFKEGSLVEINGLKGTVRIL